jgi:hypothetical protein
LTKRDETTDNSVFNYSINENLQNSTFRNIYPTLFSDDSYISKIENNVNQSKVARDSFLPICQTLQSVQQNNLDFQRQHLQQPHLLYQQQQHHY